MDKSNLISIFSKENATNLLNLILVILIAGAGYFFNTKNNNENLKSQNNSTNSIKIDTESNVDSDFIVVDISGAVKNPGVYQLAPNSRIIDVIEKAGGFTETADLKSIEKNINKAQKISDGQKIYIPDIADNLLTNQDISSKSSEVIKKSVNINKSTRAELIALPEIGEVTADKIIANRPYFELEDLVKKGCLRQNQLDKIRDLISI